MAREPELIACRDCGALNEDATMLMDQARRDVEALERDLRGKRARISALESERNEKLRQHKLYPQAMDVLRHWQVVCAPKAREIDSPERLQAVLARLRGKHTVAELKLAATGYARFPFVGDRGRLSDGQQHQWHADAELIYRTAEHVRKGVVLAARVDRPSAPAPGALHRLSWRAVWAANREAILAGIREQFGDHALLHHPLGYTVSWCPKCSPGDDDKLYRPLKVYDEPKRELAICDRCGIDDTRLIAALTRE